MKTFVTLLRREIWENSAFYYAPGIFALLLLLVAVPNGFYFGGNLIGFESMVDHAELAPEVALPTMLAAFPVAFAVVFNIIMMFVLFFYLMNSMHADRKNKSILFFKSLPVSDTETALSKIVTAMFVIPAFFVAVMLATWVLFLAAATVMVWMGGGSAWSLIWKPVPLFEMSWRLMYTFVVQSLWMAPLLAWGLFASSWARRTPFLITVLPIVGLMIAEQVFQRSAHFAQLIGERMIGVLPLAIRDGDPFDRVFDGIEHGDTEGLRGVSALIDPSHLLARPEMWAGLVVAAALVAGAVFVRRYRDET